MRSLLLFTFSAAISITSIYAANHPLEYSPDMNEDDRAMARRVRENLILYEDPNYPHPDRIAGRALQRNGGGGGGNPSSTSMYAAAMLGDVGKTTVSGTDPYSGITFGVNSAIVGPFEAGFDANIDTLLTWLGCSPASKGYLVGGIDTATSLDAVNHQCGANLPTVSNGVYKSLMWSMGTHSPPDTNGCTSPPSGLATYCTANNPAYHFHQNFTQ